MKDRCVGAFLCLAGINATNRTWYGARLSKRNEQSGERKNKSGKLTRISYKRNARRWTRQRRVGLYGSLDFAHPSIADRRCEAILLSSWSDWAFQILCRHQGQSTALSRNPLFIVWQRTRDPEYAALMDAQPKPKGRGRKKVMSVHFLLLQYHSSQIIQW